MVPKPRKAGDKVWYWGATTTLRVNKTKVIVPMGHFGSVTITLGSGQYQLDVPPNPTNSRYSPTKCPTKHHTH
ncbi:hypothetical protein QIU18_06680 [Capnocytophaga canimorsus]|nr:hypothetical protein [Capnocytophaga canimorsus]WGU71464.1 hypothetical protein QIU18_06680 [Capnocytophaga canimorsus]